MTEASPGELTRLRLLALGAAAALVPLNSTMVAVALPGIARHFDISLGRTSTLITTYLVAMLVGQPVAGRIADRFGTTRVLEVSLVAFAVASMVAAVAPSFAVLVAARVGQAAFGAALAPGTQAIVRTSAPVHQRGRLFGLLGSMLGVGAASGPVLGGALIGLFDWRSIFFLNVPIVALALLVRLPVARAGEASGPHDERAGDGSLARNPAFVAAFGVQALSTLGQYMLLLVAPVILDARGWSPASIGVALSGLTVGLIVMGPVGGRAGDRRGRGWPVGAGLAACVVALCLAAAGGRSVDPAQLVIALTLFGFGLGFALPSVQIAALETVNEGRVGSAAGVLSMSRYLGSITSSVLIGRWMTADASGARATFVVSAVALVLALVAAAGLRARPLRPALHPASGPESVA